MGQLVAWIASLHRTCVEGYQRVDAQEQAHAGIQSDGSVQSLIERSIDIVRTVDVDRWKQAGQRGRGFDSTGDGNVVEAGAAEGRRCSGVEIGRDHEQLVLELAKVVAAAGRRKEAGQKAVERALIEQASRDCPAQVGAEGGDRFHDLAPVRLSKLVQRGTRKEAGKRQAAARKLAECRSQKKRRRQRRIGAVIDEQAVHLRRGNAVR